MKTIKIIDLQKELPYKFKWKDNVYKLDGERYFRVGDNWEPTFYLFQLDEEVEILDEEDEFEDIEELNLDTDELLQKVVITAQDYVIEGKINEIIKNQKKIIERLKDGE